MEKNNKTTYPIVNNSYPCISLYNFVAIDGLWINNNSLICYLTMYFTLNCLLPFDMYRPPLPFYHFFYLDRGITSSTLATSVPSYLVVTSICIISVIRVHLSVQHRNCSLVLAYSCIWNNIHISDEGSLFGKLKFHLSCSLFLEIPWFGLYLNCPKYLKVKLHEKISQHRSGILIFCIVPIEFGSIFHWKK